MTSLAFYETTVGKCVICSLSRTFKELNKEISRVILNCFFWLYLVRDFLFENMLKISMGIYLLTLNNVNVDNVYNLLKLVILKKGYY